VRILKTPISSCRTSHRQYVEEYQHLREQTTALNSRLLDLLSRKMLKQTRRKLGLDRTAIDEEAVENAYVVMTDYAMHFARKGGRRLSRGAFRRSPARVRQRAGPLPPVPGHLPLHDL
jgi:hypothetical protein